MKTDLFSYYVEANNFYLKYAKGEPFVKQEEFHDYHEFVLFINGHSRLLSKDIQQDLTCGSIVLIPKEHFHQFIVAHPEEYERCILGFKEMNETKELIESVMTSIKVANAPNERISYLFDRLKEVVCGDLDESEKKLFIQAALVQLDRKSVV